MFISCTEPTPTPALPALVVARDGPSIITTTIFPSSTLIPSTTPHHGSTLPIASIVGGAVAGVILAIAAVIIWTWWGRCIKRDKEKEKKEMLSVLQVRENTRRNASSLSGSRSAGWSPGSTLQGHQRKVTFVSNGSVTPPTPESIAKESATGTPLSEKSISLPKPLSYTAPHAPVNPSPLSRSVSTPALPSPGTVSPPVVTAPPPPTIPTLPPPVHPSRLSDLSAATENRPSLTHQASTVSTGSMYSTQSGEARTARPNPGLLMAAFGYPASGGRKQGLPSNWTAANGEPNRLSQASSGSGWSHPSQDDPNVPVGIAV